MAVNKKEKNTLAQMWNKASASASNVPEGKYMFKIESAKYNEGAKGPNIKTLLKVVGGNEEVVGEVITQFDNLATEQNMSFFKQKLQRLGIDIPEDFTEIEDGTVCEAMEGLTFEGEVKVKGGFVNVYVNKLVDDDMDDEEDEDLEDEDTEEEDSDDAEEDSEEDNDEEESEEEDEDEEEAEDDDDSDDSDEESEEDAEEESDSEEGDEGEGFPTPDEVAAMKVKQVNEILKAIDIDPKEVAAPKKVLETMSNYLYTPKYTPEIDGFNALVKALNIKGLKGKDSKEKNKIVKKAVEDLLS